MGNVLTIIVVNDKYDDLLTWKSDFFFSVGTRLFRRLLSRRKTSGLWVIRQMRPYLERPGTRKAKAREESLSPSLIIISPHFLSATEI